MLEDAAKRPAPHSQRGGANTERLGGLACYAARCIDEGCTFQRHLKQEPRMCMSGKGPQAAVLNRSID